MRILSRSQTKRVASMISASEAVTIALDVAANHGEGPASQRGSQSVGDRAGVEGWLDRPGLERPPGVVGTGRLGADHDGPRRAAVDGQGRSGEQATAADRRDHDVERAGLLEQLERGGPCPAMTFQSLNG